MPNLVTDPVETHVHGLGVLLGDGIVRDAGGTYVVGLNLCGCLEKTHVFACAAYDVELAAHQEQCAVLDFGSGADNEFEDGAENA